MPKKREIETQKAPEDAEQAGTLIDIKPIKVERVRVKIRGLSTLIVHAWDEKVVRQMMTDRMMTKEQKKKSKENRPAPDPEGAYQGAKYIIDGADCFPTNGIKKALVTAGYALGIARSIIKQALFIRGDYAPIKFKKCTMREDKVRVGPFNNRTADIRYRPEYHDWTLDLDIEYRTDMLDLPRMLALFENAGYSVGIGEWRPEKDGQHGRFEVTQ